MSKKTNKSYNMDIRLHDKNKKYVETLQYLLDTGWNIEEKSCIGNYLFQATYSNKIKFLDLFLNHKPELINSRDYHNATILFYSNYWITKYLIDKGIDVNAITDNNNNALHYECSNKNYDIRKIKLLVESGIDVNLVNEKGNTPIDIALDKENYDIFEYLTSKGAEYDKNDSRILTTIHSKIKNLMSNNNLNNQEVKNKLLEINSKFHNQLQSL
jgi:ankyrin repeat protein